MTKQQHTPHPWLAASSGAYQEPSIIAHAPLSGKPRKVARFENQADRDFAVRACNAHDELVMILRDIEEGYKQGYVDIPDSVRRALVAILAKLDKQS